MRSLILLTLFLMSSAPVYGQLSGAARGPRINITLTDALVDLPETRKAERDDKGNLLTQPGDIIRYTLIAENTGTEQANDVEVVDPIPFGTEYVLGTALGSGMTILFSINGGSAYVERPMIDVRDEATGRIVKKPAPASMYTHVKWIIREPIMPREKKYMELRVRVLS